MFSYYGAIRNPSVFPVPLHKCIVEPFAGSARYSLKHWKHTVFLRDLDERVIGVWKYLQKASESEILALPDIGLGEEIPKNLSQEVRWLIGWSIGGGLPNPAKKATRFNNWNSSDRYVTQLYGSNSAALEGSTKYKIASNLYKIRHWNIAIGDYRDFFNFQATWFIDPPFQSGGNRYKHGTIDYVDLATWAKSRMGQVIVRENSRADWLTFKKVGKSRVNRSGNGDECCWHSLRY